MEFYQSPEEMVRLMNKAKDLIKRTPRHKKLMGAIYSWLDSATFRYLQLELPLDELMNDI